MSSNTIYPVVAIPITSLVPLPFNPFKLYEGQRLDDLVESIEANGVLVPIIIRPKPGRSGVYVIIAGHNRVQAAEKLGLKTVPAIIRNDLSDAEAMFVAIETNLIQRSFSDFSHSEKAATITLHYKGMKNQGRRVDLIKEVEMMLDTNSGKQPVTCVPVEHKLKAREKTGNELGLSSSYVMRYLRLHMLIPELKKRLNSGAISIRAAVSLSFLTEDEQELICDILTTTKCKLSMNEAEKLRLADRPLTKEVVNAIIEDTTVREASPYKIDINIIKRYFKPTQNRDEIEDIISKALEMYLGSMTHE